MPPSPRACRRPSLRALLALGFAAAALTSGLSIAALPAPPADPLDPPLRLRSLGLAFEPPAGAIWAVRLREDGRLRAVLSEPSETPAWTLAFDPYEGDPAHEAIDEVIAYLQGLRDAEARFEILVNRPVRRSDLDTHLLLLEVPLPRDPADGGPELVGVTGSLVVARGPGQFVIVSIAVDHGALATVLPLLERSLATLRLDTAAEMQAWERSLIDAGRRRIATFTPQRLEQVADGRSRWHRIHRPATADAPEREVGYMEIRAVPAPRGLIDPARTVETLRDAERDPGILVTLTVRLVPADAAQRPPGVPPEVLDIEQRAWVALDRESEIWSLRQTARAGERSRSGAETGVRLAPTAGQPRPTLEVIVADRERLARDPLQVVLPDEPYLSQAEVLLLGPLLSEIAQSGGEFAALAYDRSLGSVARRLEQVTPIESGPNRGGFEIRSLRQPDDPTPTRQRFDREGRLLERIDPDGTVTTPIDRESLRQRWARLGLPTG
jgi:hypothetical protein